MTKKVEFTKLDDLNYNSFKYNFLELNQKLIEDTCHYTQLSLMRITCCVELCKKEFGNSFNKIAPMITKVIELRDGDRKWYNAGVRTSKNFLRKKEKIYLTIRTGESRKEYELKCDAVKRANCDNDPKNCNPV